MGKLDRHQDDSHSSKTGDHDGFSQVLRRQPSGDAYAEFALSDDDMELSADIYPPHRNGLPLDRAYIDESIRNLGVTMGIDEEAIAKALETCNLDRHSQRGVVLARGQKPKNGVMEHIALDAGLVQPHTPLGSEAAKIDYKQISPFLMVKKDQVLGHKIAKQEGVEGFNLKGLSLNFTNESRPQYSLGPKTRMSGDEVLADCDGRFVLGSGGILSIDEVLEIKSDVDYHTGHVVFAGDLILDAGIVEGFKVYSGGSILCKNSVEATDINAKGDLVVQGGLIGRQEARVRVGGRLEAKFIENCKVAVRGDIQVSGALVNCRVYTMAKVDLGDKGRIAGGQVWAAGGIVAGKVGSPNGRDCALFCGIDFTVQQQMDMIQERLRILAAKQAKAQELKRQKPNPSLEAILLELSDMQATLNKRLSELIPALDSNESATIEIRDEIHPGASITICRSSIRIEKTLKRTRFHLDRQAGKVVAESIH